MNSVSFMQDLAVVLTAAGFAAVVCHRFNQPKLLGYILVGLLLGPHTPPFSFVKDEAVIHILADLGVVFLMVSLGLDFNFRRFRNVGAQAGIGALLDCGFMIGLGYLVGRHLGFTTVESLFLGAIVCDSSTTILARSLQDWGFSRDKFAGYIIGVTVVEDVLTVALIAVLTGLAVTGAVSAGMVAGSIWMLILFLATVIVVGLLTLPKLLDYFASFDNDELLVVPLVGICFGVSLLAMHAGLSMALGAVLIGAIASESKAVQRSHALIAPLRHVFSAVFFVAIGLMLDPGMLLKYWAPVLIVAGTVIAGKFTINTISALLTGHDASTAIRAGAGLAQIGEFAFIIAALGISLGVTGYPVYQIGVTAAIITIMINPYLLHGANKLAHFIDSSPACRRWTLCFQLYGEWAQRIKTRKQDDAIRKVIRRSLIMIVLNTILIVSAIACAGYLAKPQKLLIPALAEYPDTVPAILWLIAMLLCLPLYIAAIRKFGALGMLLAEMSFPIELHTPWARNMRSFISNAILMSGSLALLLMTFALSSAILQSAWVLMLLMLITVGIGFWQKPKMIKIYSQAQLAIQSVFSSDQAEPQHPVQAVNVSEHEHMNMNVRSLNIPDKSKFLGHSLHDMELRTKTGATLVGIQRKNKRIVNPGPSEIIMASDTLYIIGTPHQIHSAFDMLSTREDKVKT